MTAPELKPCPFCGGNASISKDHDPDGNGAFYAIKCRKCRAKSSEIYAVETCNIHFTQVRDAWNRRADLEPQPDPRDEVLNQAMKDAITMGEGWIRTIQDGTLQLIDPSAVRLMPDATDPRDEVIARLVEAATDAAEAIDMAYGSDDDESPHRHSAKLRAALAAAKAVQK